VFPPAPNCPWTDCDAVPIPIPIAPIVAMAIRRSIAIVLGFVIVIFLAGKESDKCFEDVVPQSNSCATNILLINQQQHYSDQV